MNTKKQEVFEAPCFKINLIVEPNFPCKSFLRKSTAYENSKN